MSDAAVTAGTRWVGWTKAVGGAWRPACEGASIDEVWSKLLSHVTAERHVERLVLPAGQSPATRRPRR